MKNVYVMLTSKRVVGTDFPPEKGVGVFADKKEAEKQQALFYANKANGCLADAQIVEAPIVGYKDELSEYKAKVKKYLDAHARLLDFCSDHLLPLADEQKQEYAELCADCEKCENIE